MNSKLIQLIPLVSLAVALIGGIPGIIATVNYFNKSKVNVSYDANKSFISLLTSDHKEHDGKKVIGFYEIKFVGGETPSTIKNIHFFIKLKRNWFYDKWIEGKQIILRTNNFRDNKSCIVMGGTERSIVLTDWTNFVEDSDKYYLQQGKTSIFNIAFEFDNTVKDIKEATEWKFIITDHSNKKYITEIKSPATTNMIVNENSANYILFDCYLNNSKDTFEMLKSKKTDNVEINYLKIQRYLKAKYNHTEEWYEKGTK